MTSPLIFIIFNRPDTTRRVFEAIRSARPPKLLVVSDGARASRAGEAERCGAARAIVEGVDWDCEVLTDYSETNLGCRRRVSSGISWAFTQVDRAIILEDDCVPSPSFFRYCDEMLERYAEDERVMMVSGDNRLWGEADPGTSYYFSRYPNIWGWATWRRAWKTYELRMEGWPELRERGLIDQYFPSASERYYWNAHFQYIYDGNVDTWDAQWVYSIWANSGYCVAPARNLVRNIGFHAEATHTRGESVYAKLGAEELEWPLVHPRQGIVRADLDIVESRLRARNSGSPRYPFNKYASALKRLLRGGAATGPHV